MDATEEDQAQVAVDEFNGLPIDSYISVFLNSNSPLISELAPGDQLTVVATVQQVDGSADNIAGSVEYQGVTTQTQASPAVRQTGGTDSVLTYAVLALFFGLWAGMTAARRHTPLWNGILGAMLGLAFALVGVVSYAQAELTTTSIMPDVYIGLPAALAGGAGFWVYSLVEHNVLGRRWRTGDRPARGTAEQWLRLIVGAAFRLRQPQTKWVFRSRRGSTDNRGRRNE